MLPHYGSFTHIYARLNLCHEGDLSHVHIIHDEQKHFDEILQFAKAETEAFIDAAPELHKIADFNFNSSASLSFAISTENLGLQIADLLAGFAMRFTSDFTFKNSVSKDHQEAFNLLFALSDIDKGTGINLVISKRIASDMFTIAQRQNFENFWK